MGIGNSMRSAVTTAITMLGSTVTITPYTKSSDDGGYTGQTETDGTPVTAIAVPFAEAKRQIKLEFGDLERAGLQLVVKYSETFDIEGDTHYKITWQTDIYDITNIDRFSIGDVLIAHILTLGKRI